MAMLTFNSNVLKTNFYKRAKSALSFRYDICSLRLALLCFLLSFGLACNGTACAFIAAAAAAAAALHAAFLHSTHLGDQTVH
jgi:hypothetical protein